MEPTVPALAVKPDWKTTQASTFLKRGDFLFELHVDAHGAGDGADGAGAYAVLGDGAVGGFFEFGVVAEAEVVVAGEVDDLAAVIGADGGLRVFKLAELEEGAGLAEVVELGGEVSELASGLWAGWFLDCGGHG